MKSYGNTIRDLPRIMAIDIGMLELNWRIYTVLIFWVGLPHRKRHVCTVDEYEPHISVGSIVVAGLTIDLRNGGGPGCGA